eukprot:213604-Chlamydomonas_euryale.AAC.42
MALSLSLYTPPTWKTRTAVICPVDAISITKLGVATSAPIHRQTLPSPLSPSACGPPGPPPPRRPGHRGGGKEPPPPQHVSAWKSRSFAFEAGEGRACASKAPPARSCSAGGATPGENDAAGVPAATGGRSRVGQPAGENRAVRMLAMVVLQDVTY